jgi:formate hydrogenlyase subunit 4
MEANNLIIAIAQVVTILVVSPLMSGLLIIYRQWLSGQKGGYVLQFYCNLRKLICTKKLQTSQYNIWFTIVGPGLSFLSLIMAATMLPLFTHETLGHLFLGDDLFLLFGLLLLSKFFQSMVSYDAPACFSTTGSGRVMMVHSTTEPIFFLIFLALALNSEDTSIYTILSLEMKIDLIPLLFILAALYLNILMECGRIPYDNPATHLELTMIEKGARIERSGIDLALAEWGESIKILILILFISGISTHTLQIVLRYNHLFGLINIFFIFVLFPLITAFLEITIPRYRVGDLPKQSYVSLGLTLIAVGYIIVYNSK